MQKLMTARLVLEPLTRHHAQEMFDALSDRTLYRYIDEAPPASVDALAARYTRLESRRSGDGREHWLNWVVREPVSGQAIGFVQASVMENGTAFVAYVIAPSSQGQGYGREATAAMIGELFARHGAKELRASVDARNAASIKLAAALGFTEARRDGGDIIFERAVSGSTAPGNR
jgi:[ribosomal protein S5]-alanine N-acetyltransferase